MAGRKLPEVKAEPTLSWWTPGAWRVMLLPREPPTCQEPCPAQQRPLRGPLGAGLTGHGA